jgi:hypothetical protein
VKAGAAPKGRHRPNEREIAAGILQVLNLNPQPYGKQRTAAPVKNVKTFTCREVSYIKAATRLTAAGREMA